MANNLELSIRISAELAELRKALQTVRDEIRQFAGSATSAGQQTQKAMNGTGEKIAEEIKQGTDSGKRSLTDLENKAKSTGKNAAKGFDPFRETVAGIKRDIIAIGAGFATLAGLQGFVAVTDEAKNLEGQLKLVTTSQAELLDIQERLRETARESRTAFASNVELYTRIARSTQGLSGSSTELNIRLTDIINKFAVLGGTPAESVNAALFQFGQGLQAGALRGEEFNSVLEGAPALAEALRKGLNVTQKELRELAEQGKLTPDIIVGALIKMGATADEQFAKLPATVRGTLTTLNDEWKKFVTELDKSTGVSKALISGLQFLRDNLQEIVLVAKIAGAALLAAFSQQIVSQIAFVITSLIRLTLQARSASVALTGVQKAAALMFAGFVGWEIGSYLREQFQAVEQFGIALAAGLNKVFLQIQGFLRQTGVVLKTIFTEPLEITKEVIAGLAIIIADFARKIPKFGEGIANGMLDLARRINPSGEAGAAMLKALDDIKRDTSKKIADADEEFFALFEAAANRRKVKQKAKPNPDAPGGGGGDNKKAAADMLALARADAEQQLQIVEALYSSGLLGLETYYDEKARLVREINDLEIAEIDRRLKAEKDAEKKSELLTKRAELEKQAATEQVKIGLEKQKALADLDKKRLEQTEQLQRDLAIAEGRGADQRIADLKRKYEAMLDEIGDTAENRAIVDRIISLERAKDRLDELKALIDQRVRDQRDEEEAIERRGNAGDPTADDAINASRAAAIVQLKEYRAELEALAQQGVPGAAEALKRLDAQMQETSKTVPTGVQKIAITARDALKSGVEDFFTSIVDGSKSAGEALRDFARSFAQQMLVMSAKALAMYALLQLLNAIPGGAAIASALDIGAKVKHSGGLVDGGTTRRVNPALFVGAPRYHSGGVAGLKPGEVPAILQTGEEVLARNDPRNVMNGGGQAQQGGGVRVINVIDPHLVSDYMTSSSGEQTILNVMQRNAGSIRQILS